MTANQTAQLTARIKRQPASLGANFYWLEPGHSVRISSVSSDGNARCFCGEPGQQIGEDFFTVPLHSLQLTVNGSAEFEPLEIWGTPGEKSLAVGPVAGGVAACEIATTDGEGRFTEATAARGARFAQLFAAAPLLLVALERLQRNPNDPSTHRAAFDAMKLAREGAPK